MSNVAVSEITEEFKQKSLVCVHCAKASYVEVGNVYNEVTENEAYAAQNADAKKDLNIDENVYDDPTSHGLVRIARRTLFLTTKKKQECMRIEFRDELKKEWVKVPGTKAYGDRTHWNIWYHPTEQYAVLAFRGTQVTIFL